SGTDRDRIDARSQVDDLSHILPKETVANERMHDEHGRIRCDDRSRRGRRRDVDEICADAQGAISDERGSARVRSARDHEDASVLTLVARRLRHGVEGELAGPDHRGDLRGDPDVRHADSSRVLGRHPFLHIMECDRDSRSDGQVRPETARDVHAEDRFPGGVHLADERRVRLAERAIHPDPEEGVDQQVCGRDRFLALVESRQDLHVPQSLEVRRGLRGGKLVRRAREEDRDAHILREMASRDEAISAVVPGAAEDEDVLSGRAELGPGDIVFAAAGLAIVPLAWFLGLATEELGKQAGPGVGGLLNATFGNATELIIAIFALSRGLTEVVKASLTGSIVGNLLLVLGLSMLAGGVKYEVQHFSREASGIQITMPVVAVIALVMPALSVLSTGIRSGVTLEEMSLGIAGILLLAYVFGLFFSLRTHRDIFNPVSEVVEKPRWEKRFALSVLVVSTVLVAVESEILVGSLETARQ